MMVKRFLSVLTALGMAALLTAGCSSDDSSGDDTGSTGGGVGAKCTSNDQCTGYDNPACITSHKPLDGKITDPSHPLATDFEELELPFPGGSCGTPIDMPCSKGTCGDSGDCFIPFDGVTEDTITSLEGLGLPFDIREFEDLAICLQPCDTVADCRSGAEAEGYSCEIPFKAFFGVLNPKLTQKYCVVDVDVSNLLQ